MAKTETANYIKVTQVKSAIGRIEPQKRTMKALGLGKISSSSVLPDNPAVRGMVNAVAHLIKVETAEKPAQKSIWKTKALRSASRAMSKDLPEAPKAEAPAAAKAPAGKQKAEAKPATAKATEAKPAAAKKAAAKPAAAKKAAGEIAASPKKRAPRNDATRNDGKTKESK
jgi:large subunit ribosomal protein L30